VIALVLSVLLLLVNGFFVALEFSLVAARRTRLEPLGDRGDRRAVRALRGMRELDLQLSGAQLGITMASLGLGFLAEPVLAEAIRSLLGRFVDLPEGVAHGIAFAASLTVVAYLHMVVGEMVPKSLALSAPEKTLLRVAGPKQAFLLVFRPVIRVLTEASNRLVRLCGVEPRSELAAGRTAAELATMLAESHDEGYIEDFAHDLLTGALDFAALRADSVMVARADVAIVASDATVAEVEQQVVATGHSRLPVAQGGDPDRIVGFVHAKDLLSLGPGAEDAPLPRDLVRRMLVVPRDRSLEDVLRSMRSTRIHVALVVDPDRTTAGLVTLEDLLEELVGEITDESDRLRPDAADRHAVGGP
jgi:CBS domain containing-hemolysin-like protein